MTEIAGYVAEAPGLDGMLCYGFGETAAIARMKANHAFSDDPMPWRAIMRESVAIRPVGPEEASEILEMLETPW